MHPVSESGLFGRCTISVAYLPLRMLTPVGRIRRRVGGRRVDLACCSSEHISVRGLVVGEVQDRPHQLFLPRRSAC